MTHALELFRLMRPYQWVKNSFVFAGLLFGHAFADAAMGARVLAAFAAFCLVASGIYIVNDLLDREQDRRHPVKQKRPLAAGTVSAGSAGALAAALFVAGFGGAWLASPAVTVFVTIYVSMNIGYSLGLKHVVILDVFMIAAGFMLRLLAGTVGVGIPPSRWLLLCGLMVALFLGFVKRRSEIGLDDEHPPPAHRRVLEHYTPAMLDAMIVIAAACMVLTYSLYTMSPDTMRVHGTNNLIYTVPLVLFGIFRYLFILYRRQGGGDPTRDLIRDPFILGSMGLWLALTLWLIR